jgi:hypothetical protein
MAQYLGKRNPDPSSDWYQDKQLKSHSFETGSRIEIIELIELSGYWSKNAYRLVWAIFCFFVGIRTASGPKSCSDTSPQHDLYRRPHSILFEQALSFLQSFLSTDIIPTAVY